MTPPRHVLNSFLVDAGMLYVGTVPIGWGASRGGLTFEPGAATRFPEADGITTPIDGTGRVTGYESRITGRIMDASPASIMRMMPGSTSDGSASNNAITPINARTFITTGQTLEDVLLIYRVSDNTYEATYFRKAMVERWNQSGPDSDEGQFDISIRALLTDTQDPAEPPFLKFANFDLDTFDPADYTA